MAGVGIFWCLIEKLRSEKDFSLQFSDIDAFAIRWHTNASDIKKVIMNYKLFKIDGEIFYSERLKQSMDEKSQKARLSANYRWNNTDASERMQSNAIKEKKRKEKKSISNTDFSDEKKNTNTKSENGVDEKLLKKLTRADGTKMDGSRDEDWAEFNPRIGIQPD